MNFGLFLMPIHHPLDNPSLAFERDLDTIRWADELGFDEAWVGEHHTGGWENIPAPDVFLSAVARETQRIRLGAGVVNLPYHHPFHVAERWAFLDQLTRGRTMLGFGSGALVSDIKMFDIPVGELRPRTREAAEIILKLYHEDGPVSHEGEYWSIKDMQLQVKPYQRPRMPIAMPCGGPGASFDLITKHGLGMLSGGFFGGTSAKSLKENWLNAERKAAELGNRLDRHRDLRMVAYVYLADSDEEALADIKRGVEAQVHGYWFQLVGKRHWQEYDGQPDEEIGVKRIVERSSEDIGWIVGDPDHALGKLKAFERDTGGFGTFIIVCGDWAPQAKWRHSLELFARHVMPHFNGWSQGLSSSHGQLVADTAAGRLPSPRTFVPPPASNGS